MSYSSSQLACTAPWPFRTRIAFLVLTVIACVSTSFARGQDAKRPEVHADFVFGSFPYSTEATELFDSADIRMLVVAFDRGWSVEKFAEETGHDEIDVLMLVDDLEREDLVRGLNDFDMKPGLLLMREPEGLALSPHVDADAAEMVGIIEDHWKEVDQFVNSLEAGKTLPAGERFYSAVVGGLLTGGMIDALLEDQTLVPRPPRRGSRSDGYYAWLVEGNAPAPTVRRETARVGRYTVVSIGTGTEENLRIQIEELRGQGLVLESQDADRWRIFASVFSRDHLFPYFKARRPELLDLHESVRSSRYTAFGEFAAWYYQMVVTRVTEMLVADGRITAPETRYKYAVRNGR